VQTQLDFKAGLARAVPTGLGERRGIRGWGGNDRGRPRWQDRQGRGR